MSGLKPHEIKRIGSKMARNLSISPDIIHAALSQANEDVFKWQACDNCKAEWDDGISGCPTCGNGNPYKEIKCLGAHSVKPDS